jgi:ankyrin repeat protein
MNKNTPLHVAAKHGHLLIAMQLVENGGDTTLANSYGESALDMTHAAA